MDRVSRRQKSRHGFTLLELTIVLFVFSILFGGVLSRMAQETRLDKQRRLAVRLDAIESALVGVGVADRRLPCPADGALPLGAVGFGRETNPAGACTSGSPAGTFGDGANTAGGVLPVKALGLPDEYMFDPWGGRFTYVVDRRATAAGALDLYRPDGRPVDGVTDEAARIGSMTVKDHYVADGSDVVRDRTQHAVAVVISHGENGHGAYQSSGARKSSGSNHDDEQTNCRCNSVGGELSFGGELVMEASGVDPAKAAPNTFDDTVRYFVRANFLSAADRLTETR